MMTWKWRCVVIVSLALIAGLQHASAQTYPTRAITLVQRAAHGFTEREFRAGEQVALETPEVTFTVDEIYEGIQLDS